uniref:Uncharacterized protein n=1 Tax=Glossina pallidipes TaxID=7398 RepID=A0A1A9Z246_GLOPL
MTNTEQICISTARKRKARKEIERQQVSKTNEQLILAEEEERIVEITNLEEFVFYTTKTRFRTESMVVFCESPSRLTDEL